MEGDFFYYNRKVIQCPTIYGLTNMCSCYIILLIKEVMQHMKITKAYQFRLYLTKEQEVLVHKTFGCTRFLYNQMLDEKRKDKMLSKFDLFKKIPEYIKNYPFLSEVDSCSLRNSITDLMIGFDRYYKQLGGYPNYQKRGVK